MSGNFYPGYDILVTLVMQNQAEKVITLIESGVFDTRFLNDIGCCERPLPLYKLSLCNAILLEDNTWSKKFLPVVKRNRRGCKAMLDYWDKQ